MASCLVNDSKAYSLSLLYSNLLAFFFIPLMDFENEITDEKLKMNVEAVTKLIKEDRDFWKTDEKHVNKFLFFYLFRPHECI